MPNNNYVKIVNKERYFKESYKKNKIVAGGPEKKDYTAAGIIPYSVAYSESENIISFLLNQSPKGLWTYFGGGIEDIDQRDPKKTALREAFEESYDLKNKKRHLPVSQKLSDSSLINDLIRNREYYIIPKLNESNSKWNNIYFVKVDRDYWENNHNNNNYYSFDNEDETSYVLNKEVEKMEWFTLTEIFGKIREKKIINFIASIFGRYAKEFKSFN
jgi:NUDIX domain